MATGLGVYIIQLLILQVPSRQIFMQCVLPYEQTRNCTNSRKTGNFPEDASQSIHIRISCVGHSAIIREVFDFPQVIPQATKYRRRLFFLPKVLLDTPLEDV